MKIVMFPNPSGSAYWRLIDPAKYLRDKGFEIRIGEAINDEVAEWADIYILQNCVDKKGISLLYAYQQERGKKIISEWDDFFEANESNPHKKTHEVMDYPEVSKIVLGISDLVTVTTDYLKSKYEGYNKNVIVLPNYMDMRRWDRPKKRNKSKHLRLGWAGSITHLEDLKMIEKPLKKVLREFPSVQLVIVGDMRFSSFFDGFNKEVMLGVPFDYWPDKLNGLQLDIGLAPLVDNEFNRCKSNIKWQEYSIARVPGVYSSVVYSKSVRHIPFDGVLGMTADTQEQWYRCVKNYIICENLRNDISNKAYSVVKQEYNLEKNIKEWVNAYTKLTQ